MITIAGPEHLPAINNIYNQAVAEGFRTAHTEPTSLEERKHWFTKHSQNHPVFIYLNARKPIGWLSLSPYRPGRQALNTVVEVSYYIDFNHHGRGIATQLMQHGVDFCLEAGYKIMVAILISGNKPSIGLLHKFGFGESGRISNAIRFKEETRDHLYMTKYL